MSDANTPNLPKQAGKELGYSGTLIMSGIITNEEYNQNLVGRSGNQKYEIMRRSDATIRSTLQIVKLPLLSTTWRIEPVKQPDGTITPEDQEKADFIQRELMGRNVKWFKFLKQALTCFDFGHSVFEKVYEVTEFNGKIRIGLAKLASRKQVSIYRWETSDSKPGIVQMTGTQMASIPREKLLVVTYDQEGDNYEGTSLLRYVYKDWDLKDKLTIVNAMALEKLGVGVPTVTARDNETPSPEDEEDAIQALSNLRANQKSYLKVPSTMTIGMLDLKANTTKDVIPTLNYHDSRIMKSILAGFMELGGSSGSGAQALAKDLSSIFFKSEEAAANEVIAAVTDDLIKQLCELNYSDNSSGYPILTHGSIADDDNTALADQIQKLMQAGAIHADADLEEDLRGKLRLPEMGEDVRQGYKDSAAAAAAARKALANGETIDDGTGNGTSDTPATDKKDTKTLDKAAPKKDVAAALREASNYRHKLLGMMAQG